MTAKNMSGMGSYTTIDNNSSRSASSSIKSQIIIMLSLVKIGFIRFQIYRLSNIINIFSAILLIIVQYFLWRAIYESNVNLGYSFYEIFLYMLLTQVLFTFFPSNTSRQFAQLMKSGDIVHRLLKPYGLIRQFFFEGIGNSIFSVCYISIPVLLISFTVFDSRTYMLEVGRYKIMLFVFSLLLSYVFVFIFESIVGLWSFYTVNTWGLQSFKYAMVTFLSGRFLPLSLYPDSVRKVADMLPFKMMYFLPLNYLLKDDGQAVWALIFYQAAWNLIAFAILMFFLKFTLAKLLIQGG